MAHLNRTHIRLKKQEVHIVACRSGESKKIVSFAWEDAAPHQTEEEDGAPVGGG